MKSFTDLFIKRPVLAIVVNLVILIAGLQSIRKIGWRHEHPRKARGHKGTHPANEVPDPFKIDQRPGKTDLRLVIDYFLYGLFVSTGTHCTIDL